MTQDVENRIRELCALITDARPEDFPQLIADLKSLLSEHSLKLENLIAAQRLMLAQTDSPPKEELPEPKLKTA